MHAIVHRGVQMDIRESSALKVDSGRKIPHHTRELPCISGMPVRYSTSRATSLSLSYICIPVNGSYDGAFHSQDVIWRG